MSKERELEHKFWKAVKADRTMMLGVDGIEDGHAQPMTALLDPDDREDGPIWFFTTKENGLVKAMQKSSRAMAHSSPRTTSFSPRFTAISFSTTTRNKSNGCGIPLSRHGSRAGRTIRSFS